MEMDKLRQCIQNKTMEKNNLLNSLQILSSEAEIQRAYLRKLNNGFNENVDELMLEYEDTRFLWSNYSSNIQVFLEEISELLDVIDDKGLHEVTDLDNKNWNQIRLLSRKTLSIIKLG